MYSLSARKADDYSGFGDRPSNFRKNQESFEENKKKPEAIGFGLKSTPLEEGGGDAERMFRNVCVDIR
jgi:hypothetical protein